MLDSIKKLFSSSEAPVPESDDRENNKDLSLAACALLLELAYADAEFTQDEREHFQPPGTRAWVSGFSSETC